MRLVVSDDDKAPKAAVQRVLDCTWQRCQLRFHQDRLTYVGCSGWWAIATLLNTAFVQDTAKAACAPCRQIASQVSPNLPK